MDYILMIIYYKNNLYIFQTILMIFFNYIQKKSNLKNLQCVIMHIKIVQYFFYYYKNLKININQYNLLFSI